jgi:phospholipid-binding lipoprotein MlaA
MTRIVVLLCALSCGWVLVPLSAAAQGAPEGSGSGAPQTRFVDLTQGAPVPVAPPMAPSLPAAAPATNYVDLSLGTMMPVSPPERAPDSAAPRMRHVDLSLGAEVPLTNELADLLPEADRVTVTGAWPNDPYEAANRRRFRSHVGLHRYLIDPVEKTYIAVVPGEGREVVHNLLTNLETPSVLANDLFQGDIGRAGDTLSRFVVNTTLGLGGLMDVAGMAGMSSRDNDFGATLAEYGVGDYPYLLVPAIGPSNPRDLGGKLVDFFLNPLRWVALPGGIVGSAFHAGVHELDKRSADVGELDLLARTAPDAYAVERARALERRAKELGDVPAE